MNNKNIIDFDSYLKKTFKISFNSKKLYVLIPTSSCKSCIDELVLTLQGVSNTDNFVIILIDYSSVSMLPFKRNLENFKILKDLKVIALKKQIINQYPKLIWKEDNNFRDLEVISVKSEQMNKMFNLIKMFDLKNK